MLKCTLLFQQSTPKARVGGWSETWYLDTDIMSAVQPCRALQGARANMLSNRAQCIGTRITQIGGRTYTDATIFPGRVGDSGDIPQMALLLKVGDATLTYSKIFTIRGFLDANVEEGEYTPTRAMQQSLATMASVLIAGPFRFRAKSTSGATASVVSVDAAGNFVLSSDMTFAVGDRFQLIRMRGVGGVSVSGIYYVSARTDARHGTFAGWGGIAVNGSGKIRSFSYTYPLVAEPMQVLRVIPRKVGRPFVGYRGRVSTRR